MKTLVSVSEHLIVPLALLSIAIGLGVAFGGLVGAAFLGASVGFWHGRHHADRRQRDELERRWRIREAAWRAGDRRSR